MTFSGRFSGSGGLSREEEARLGTIANDAAVETNAQGGGFLLNRIRRTTDNRDLEALRQQLEERQASGALTSDERVLLSEIQNRQRDLRVREARVQQLAARDRRQGIPSTADDIVITPEIAQALIDLNFEPTIDGYQQAAAERNLDIVDAKVQRYIDDSKSEVEGVRSRSRAQLRDVEADEAARGQNFGGVVGDRNRQAGSLEARASEQDNAEFSREEGRDFDQKRANRQGDYERPFRGSIRRNDGSEIPVDQQYAERPRDAYEYAKRKHTLKNVDVPQIPDVDPRTKRPINKNDKDVIKAYKWGGKMHQAALRKKRENFANQIEWEQEQGARDFSRDADGSQAAIQDFAGEEWKQQDFNQINPNEQYDRLVGTSLDEDVPSRVKRYFDRQILRDASGRARYQGSPEVRPGEFGPKVTEKGYYQGNAAALSRGNSAVNDALFELEEAVANGMLDPNMPITQEAIKAAGLPADLMDNSRSGTGSEFEKADLDYKINYLVKAAENGDPQARELVRFNDSNNPADGKFFKGEPVIDQKLIEAARQLPLPETELAANRSRVFNDSQGRTVQSLIDGLKASAEGPRRLARKDRQQGRLAVKADARAMRGMPNAAERALNIEAAERAANQARRPEIRPTPFAGPQPTTQMMEAERARRVQRSIDRQDGFALRQLLDGKSDAEVSSILAMAGIDKESKSTFVGGDPATPHRFFSADERAALDAGMQNPGPQGDINYNNRRLVNNAKAGIGVVQAQINTLARAARRKGSPLTSGEKQRILGAMTQEIMPNEQIVKIDMPKAKFDRELVRGNYQSTLRDGSFDYEDGMKTIPIIDRDATAFPVQYSDLDASGKVKIANYVDPVTGAMAGESNPNGFFDDEKKEWYDGVYDSDEKRWVPGSAQPSELTIGEEWVQDHIYHKDYDSMDEKLGEAFKVQNVGRPLEDLTDRFRVKGVPLQENIKTPSDLAKASRELAILQLERGKPIQHWDPDLGRRIDIDAPEISDVLDNLGVGPAQQKTIARSLHIQNQAMQFDKDGRRANNADKVAFANDVPEGRFFARRNAELQRQAQQMQQEQFGSGVGLTAQQAIRDRRIAENDRSVQRLAQEATINMIGDAQMVDGTRVNARGRVVQNRADIGPQLRALDPGPRIEALVQEGIAQGQELAALDGRRLNNNEINAIRNRVQQEQELALVDDWIADARKPFIGANGINEAPQAAIDSAARKGLNRTPEMPNRGNNQPNPVLNQPQPVFKVNINDADAQIGAQLQERGRRNRGVANVPVNPQERARLIAIRDDQINADFARDQLGSGSRIIREPSDAAEMRAFQDQERLQAANDARLVLTPAQEQAFRIAEEQRRFGTAAGSGAALGGDPNVLRNQMLNNDGPERAAGYPGLDSAGYLLQADPNAPTPGGRAAAMTAPGQPGYDSRPEVIRQISPASTSPVAVFPGARSINSPGIESTGIWESSPSSDPLVSEWRNSGSGIGRIQPQTQASPSVATSQQVSGTPNIASRTELVAPTSRQQVKPSWSNPRSQSPDPWTSSNTPEEGITSEIRKRTGGGRSQRALPYGIQTSGPSQDVYRPIGDDIKNQLAELNSGFTEQGPRPSANRKDPGIRPDGPTSPVDQESRRRRRATTTNAGKMGAAVDRRMRRYGRGAAVAGGVGAAIAGADGLVGGERERREEEQAAAYMR